MKERSEQTRVIKYRYRKVSERLAKAIEVGAYRSGDRLPSIRDLMASEGISQATAIRAMLDLEERGLITSRQRSGFFVKATSSTSTAVKTTHEPSIPPATESSPKPNAVNVHHLTQDLFRASRTPKVVALGAADIAKNLMPVAALSSATRQALRGHGAPTWQTPDPHGVPELRRAIARLMALRGMDSSPDDVLITGGETDAMALALRTVTKPGDTVAIESPTFFGILKEIQEAGLKAIEISTHPTTGIDIDDLLWTADNIGFRAVVLNPTFQNPFGCCMELYALRKLTEEMSRRGIPVIEDDVYSDLSFGGKPMRALASSDNMANTIYCSSFSKTISPGLRIGWCIPGRFAPIVKEQLERRPVTTSTLAQITLAEYLRGRRYARHRSQLCALFEQQKSLVRRLIKENFPPGTTATDPSGGYLFWVEVPQPFDAMTFYKAALEKGISIAPGPIFSPSNRFPHAFRLSVGCKLTSEIQRAIQTLGRIAGDTSLYRVGSGYLNSAAQRLEPDTAFNFDLQL